MFHITFVQIGVFDWLSGRQKGSIFVKMFKNLLLRNHMEDAAETWHTCLGHYLLQKLSLNVTTSGRNCNTIFDVLTSKMPNADRSKHAFVCVFGGGGCYKKFGTSK